MAWILRMVCVAATACETFVQLLMMVIQVNFKGLVTVENAPSAPSCSVIT